MKKEENQKAWDVFEKKIAVLRKRQLKIIERITKKWDQQKINQIVKKIQK